MNDGYAHELRLEIEPRWVFALPRRLGLDRLARVERGVLHRLLHVDGEPTWLRVAQPARRLVVIGARSDRRDSAEAAIAAMRAALGVDHDLRAFYERYRDDPLIGRSVRANPGLRVAGRPDAFEALLLAICEQLIEYERAAAIQRRLIAILGRRCERSGLRDVPSAQRLARQAPALLESCGLSAGRALALIKAAREVAAGRIDLRAADPEHGWRRLRAIPGIGSWTVQMLALTGQGRLDQLPAGDLAYLKLVGRLRGRSPYARASEQEVRECFERYGRWAGLAGAHALRAQAGFVPSRLAA